MDSVGRYRIERLLARGGMAEVFLAHVDGPGGFSKQVVLKSILPELSEDARFAEMFLDEARLAARLSHPNLVQVFDFGEHQGRMFLVMEYVEGSTLRSLSRRARKFAHPLSLPLAVQLAQHACRGLHYAHELKGDDKQPLGLVHRDVTPENLLLSVDGAVKLADFGIAKAASAAGNTRAGMVKGKLPYLAPEQLRSRRLDRRVDVYALGLSLYEIILGQRPFSSGDSARLIQLIEAGECDPLVECAGVSEALSEVVATAMHPDPERRFPTAQAFAQALESVKNSEGLYAEEDALAQWVRSMPEDDGDQPAAPPPQAVPDAPLELAREVRGSGPHPVIRPPADSPPPDFERPPAAPPPPARSSADYEKEELRAWLAQSQSDALRAVRKLPPQAFVGGFVALGLLSFGLYWLLSAPSRVELNLPPPPKVAPIKVALPPPPPPPPPAPPLPPSLDAGEAELDSDSIVMELPEDAQTPKPARKRPLAAVPKNAPVAAPAAVAQGNKGFLTLTSEPQCNVYVDGARVGVTPLRKLPLSPGRYKVTLRNDAAGAYRQLDLDVRKDAEATQNVNFPTGSLLLKASKGTLVRVNGVDWGKLPMGALTLVEGNHQLRLYQPKKRKEDRRQVTIRRDERSAVTVPW